MASWREKACRAVLVVVIVIGLGFLIKFAVISNYPTYVTVSLNARGLDPEEHSRTPVEFDVSIGFLHLHWYSKIAHDGGQVTISYAGIKLAEGPVSKFYIAGGPTKWVEATRAVASAGKDQAPLSQILRDHVWVDQQMNGEAEFDVALSFFDLNITTGKTTRSYYHTCKVGLALREKTKFHKCWEE